MSRFKSDLTSEAILGRFLTDHYTLRSIDFTRISDKEIQLAGVDVIIGKANGLTFKVDEKAQLHYLNKDLPTFALEIDYLLGDESKKGWLYDTQKVTEIYVFVFSIHLIDGKDILQQKEDIRSCEVIFVNRLRLITELSNLEITPKDCGIYSNRLRTSGLSKIQHEGSGFNFQISNHLSEKPVNLVVPKSFLERIGKKYTFQNSDSH